MKGQDIMKKTTKIISIIFAFLLLICALGVSVFAAAGDNPSGAGRASELPTQDAPLANGATFEVIASNGKRRSSGVTDVEFKNALEKFSDGDTVILLGDIRIVARDNEGNVADDVTNVENAPYSWAIPDIKSRSGATLNIDLNGHGVILVDDRVLAGGDTQNVFYVSGNIKLNFYSSQPDAFVFASSSKMSSAGYYTGGYIFSISENPTVNIGRFKKPDGTVVSGNNLTTSAPGFINLGGDANNPSKAQVTVDGGTYYRFSTGSQVGLIAQREESASTLTVKNANLICSGYNSTGGNYMLRGPKSVTRFDNCLIYNVNAGTNKLDMVSNYGGGVNGKEYYRFTGKLVLKDCVTSYNLSEVSLYPQNSDGYIGQLHLEGETVFRADAITVNLKNSYETYKNGFTQKDGGFEEVYKGMFEEGLVLARVSAKYEVEGNPIRYIPGFADAEYRGDAYKYEIITLQPVELTDASAFIKEEDAFDCKFVDTTGKPTEYKWKKGDKIVPPSNTNAPNDAMEGVFRYEWVDTENKDGSHTVQLMPYSDFEIKVSYSLYSDFALNIYVPKDTFDTYVDPIDCYINGNIIKSGSGEEVTLKTGDTETAYYRFTVNGISPAELLTPISIKLPINFWEESKGKRIEGPGEWQVDIIGYAEKICAANSGYSEAEKKMANALLNYVKVWYDNNVEDSDWSDADYLRLTSAIDTDNLTVDNETLAELVNSAIVNTLDASFFGSYTTDSKAGSVTFKFNEGFTGTLKIYLGSNTLEVYEIENGKYKGASEFTLKVPSAFIFSPVKVAVLNKHGKVLSSSDIDDRKEGVTGRVSPLKQDYAADEVITAYYVYAYCVSLAAQE